MNSFRWKLQKRKDTRETLWEHWRQERASGTSVALSPPQTRLMDRTRARPLWLWHNSLILHLHHFNRNSPLCALWLPVVVSPAHSCLRHCLHRESLLLMRLLWSQLRTNSLGRVTWLPAHKGLPSVYITGVSFHFPSFCFYGAFLSTFKYFNSDKSDFYNEKSSQNFPFSD